MRQKRHILHFKPSEEFIRATQKGGGNLAAGKQLVADVAKAARGTGGCHILIDLRGAVSALSVFDIWELAEELRKYEEFGRRMIALVVSGTGEVAEVFKLFAENRHYYFRVFHDFQKANDWLSPKSKTRPVGDRDKPTTQVVVHNRKSERKDDPEIKTPP